MSATVPMSGKQPDGEFKVPGSAGVITSAALHGCYRNLPLLTGTSIRQKTGALQGYRGGLLSEQYRVVATLSREYEA